VREELFAEGELIHPGRWGTAVLSYGIGHPQFAREALGESRRLLRPSVQVSRYARTYALEELAFARERYACAGHRIYRVTPPTLLQRVGQSCARGVATHFLLGFVHVERVHAGEDMAKMRGVFGAPAVADGHRGSRRALLAS
jgi:hypothetical protein